MILLIIGFATIIGLEIARDFFIYKHRGRVRGSDHNEGNLPVIADPSDACAQRLIDLSNEKKSKGGPPTGL
jgi:hypothetical protein